jgi:glycosyltransferase involved in cell wall biosynthesis
MIDLTILFSTRNGASVLRRTLDGYVRQKDPGFGWKIVVVDNGSTDETADIIGNYRTRLPIETTVEPRPGKNRALNLGLGLVEGEIIVLSDDDAIPEPGFLSAWSCAFRRWPAGEVFGGSVLPLFDAPPPDWMLESAVHFEELYAMRRNLAAGPIDPLGIFGPNMAVRRSIFASGLKFNESIGPNGADINYGMGSESEFCARANRLGHATWFVPDPAVQHIVRPHQVTLDYCAKRAYRLGRGAAQQQLESGTLKLRNRSPAMQLAARGWGFSHRLALAARTLRRDRLERFKALWEYQFHRGFHHERDRQRQLQS